MVARPGRYQSAFTAGELDPALHGRTSLKYYSNGVEHMENARPIPQGGFETTDGTRSIGRVDDGALTGCEFTASTGEKFDLVFAPGRVEMWDEASKVFELTDLPYSTAQLRRITFAQRLDTLLIFHPNVKTRRIKFKASGNWAIDIVPYDNLPRYDYGADYTNGVAAVWELQFINVTESMVFKFTLNGTDTESMIHSDNPSTPRPPAEVADMIEAALKKLDFVSDKITVEPVRAGIYEVTFKDMPGDDWVISGQVINAVNGAITANKTTSGKRPGEPIMSAERGWPACGCFYQQRLVIGGLKGLPSMFGFSLTADYYNFSETNKQATGSFFVPMDAGGGEEILRVVNGRNLLIFTTSGEYWVAERAISKTTPPNIVQSSQHGARRGVPVVENEGAALFVYAQGGEVGEFRYADTDGSFVTSALSILGSHLVRGATGMAIRRATSSTSGNLLAVLTETGLALATLLREQDVTGFYRRTTDGTFVSVWTNGRNELCAIVERLVFGASQRFLERFEEGLLVDGAVTIAANAAPRAPRHGAAQVWVYDDKDVQGPFRSAGANADIPGLDVSPKVRTVGRWRPPVVKSLPPARDVAPNIVVQRPIRIHSLQVSLQGTTSLALAVNGKAPRDVPLADWGTAADVGEFDAAFTGIRCVRGFTGFVDEPSFTISQVRPGRLRVRAVTAESSIS